MAILATGVTKVSGKVADTNGEVVLTAADVGAATNTRKYSGDLNSLTLSGFYSLSAGALNTPSSRTGQGDQLTHYHWDANAANQIYLAYDTRQMWFRNKAEVNWSSWNEIYHSNNAVGSGGIIERGSNANGEYVKFADGTLICTVSSENDIGSSSPVGSLFIGSTALGGILWPSAFVSAPKESIKLFRYNPGASAYSGYSIGCIVSEDDNVSNTTSSTFKSIGALPWSYVSVRFNITAIGRWK